MILLSVTNVRVVDMLEQTVVDVIVKSLEVFDLVLGTWVDLDAAGQVTVYGSDLAEAIARISIWVADVASRLALNIST